MITGNLALAFADRERPTILVDADVRRGGLHRTFGFSSSPGLADYLRGDADTVVIAKATDTDGLYFIPRGNYSDDVPELLDGEGLPARLTFHEIIVKGKAHAHRIPAGCSTDRFFIRGSGIARDD